MVGIGSAQWRGGPATFGAQQQERESILNKLRVFEKWPLFYFPALANTPGLEFKKGPPRDAETQRQSDTETPTHNGTEP